MAKQESTVFAEKSPPTYEADDGPLDAEDIARIRNAAQSMLPEGQVLSTRSSLHALVNDDSE